MVLRHAPQRPRPGGNIVLRVLTALYHLFVTVPVSLAAELAASWLPTTISLPNGAQANIVTFLQFAALGLAVPFALAMRSKNAAISVIVVVIFHYANQFDTAILRALLRTKRVRQASCPRAQLWSDVVSRAFLCLCGWSILSAGVTNHGAADWHAWGLARLTAVFSAAGLVVLNALALASRIDEAYPKPPATSAAFARVGGFGVTLGISALGKAREIADTAALCALAGLLDREWAVRIAERIYALAGAETPAWVFTKVGGCPALTLAVTLAPVWAAVLLNADHLSHKFRTERAHADSMRRAVRTLAPQEPSLAAPRTDNPKYEVVYTIGCFDMFHAGHVKLMQRLRAHGRRLVVGVHDDESINLLKGRFPIDNTVRRVRNAKRYADAVFVIPSTEPSPYLDGVVDRSIPKHKMCYIRGADMPQFPGREVAEQLMEILLLPYTEGVSSSLLRTRLFERRNSVDAPSGPRPTSNTAQESSWVRSNGTWINTALEPPGVAWIRSGHDFYRYWTDESSPTIA